MFRPGSVYLCPPKLIRYKAGLHRGEIRQEAGAILYGAQLGEGFGKIPAAPARVLRDMGQGFSLFGPF